MKEKKKGELKSNRQKAELMCTASQAYQGSTRDLYWKVRILVNPSSTLGAVSQSIILVSISRRMTAHGLMA